MSELTVLVAATEALFKQLEKRLEIVEKKIGLSFHGNSGYTKGCRCLICKDARTKYMRKFRARLNK